MDSMTPFLLYSSVFSQARRDYLWGIDPILNNICMWITTMLSYLLDVVQAIVEGAWNFLQYSSFGFSTNGETITKQLKGKIGGSTYTMANSANSTDAASLYKFFTDYLWIPLGVALLFFIIKFVFLDKKSDNIKRFTNNIGALVVIVLILPYVFVNVNTLIFKTSDSSPILSVDSESLSSKILYQNTTDYLYIHDTIASKKGDKQVQYVTIASLKNRFGNFKLQDKNGKKIYKNLYLASINGKSKKEARYFYKLSNIENFPINDTVTGSIFDKKLTSFGRLYLEAVEGNVKKEYASANKNLSEKSFNDKKEDMYYSIAEKVLDKINKYSPELAKAEIKNYMGIAGEFTNTDLTEKMGSFGINMGDVGKEYYFRYRVNFLCVWIEMLANIFLYFSAAYAIIKIGWELVINRIFAGTLAAIDLSGGEKIKKLLNNLLGLYAALMFTAFTLVLYNDACGFIIDNVSDGNEVIQAVLVALLASVALDGPNVIAKYFGVETGMRGGASFLKSGIRNGIMLHRMGQMNRNMRRQRASSAVKNGGAFGKATHPFAAAKQAVSNKTNKAVDNIKTGFKNKKDATKEAKDELANAIKNADSLYDKKSMPNSYLDNIRQDNKEKGLGLSEQEMQDAANKMFFNDHKDEMLDKSFAHNLSNSNKDAKKAIEKAANDIGINNAQSLAQAGLGEYEQYKNATYNNLADNAKAKLSTKNSPYKGMEMNAYRDTAKEYFSGSDIKASNRDVERLAHRTYGEAHREQLNRNVDKVIGNRRLEEQMSIKYSDSGLKTRERRYSDDDINKIKKKTMVHQLKQKGYKSSNAKEIANRALEN